MSLSFIVGPLVGAAIGGITNGIAIKMLFRPINPVKIGNFTLPFTPGVIPKEKERIARKVGEVISKELLNEEVLKKWLLKEEIFEQIKGAVENYLQEYSEDETKLSDKLSEIVGKEKSMYYVCEIEEQITEKLYSKVLSMELGKMIVDKIQSAYHAGSFHNILGPMSFFVNDNLVESISKKIEPVITKFIEEEGEDTIRKAVEDESSQLLNQTVKDCMTKLQKYEEIIKKNTLALYEKIVTFHLARILNTLNIAAIVQERILAFDSLEMEKIILSIMKKELNAIVWFGVLLGAIMGAVMSFV